MPIYEYQCDGCQEVFEVRQRMTDPAPAQHACGSTALHRVLSATSFVLKGTGWYATDYGNRSQPPPEAGEGPSKGKPANGSGKEAKASGTQSAKGQDGAGGSAGSEAKTTSPASKGEASSSQGAGPSASAGGGSKAAL